MTTGGPHPPNRAAAGYLFKLPYCTRSRLSIHWNDSTIIIYGMIEFNSDSSFFFIDATVM
jgi:hypothetical protein